MNLYREQILDHYQNPRNWGRINKSSATGKAYNDFCGDKIDLDIVVDDFGKKNEERIITSIAFHSEGCAISTASVSILTEYVKGKMIGELKHLTKDDIVAMLGIELTPTRLKCALLSLEALHKAIESV